MSPKATLQRRHYGAPSNVLSGNRQESLGRYKSGDKVSADELGQEVMGYTAIWAGFTVAPVGLLAIFFSPLVDAFQGKFDPRLLNTRGFAVFADMLVLDGGLQHVGVIRPPCYAPV